MIWEVGDKIRQLPASIETPVLDLCEQIRIIIKTLEIFNKRCFDEILF